MCPKVSSLDINKKGIGVNSSPHLVPPPDAGRRVGGVPAAVGEALELGGTHQGELAPAAAVV